MSKSSTNKNIVIEKPIKEIKRYPPRGISLSHQNEFLRETMAKEEKLRDRFDKNLTYLKQPYNPIVGNLRGQEEYAIPIELSIARKLEQISFNNTINITTYNTNNNNHNDDITTALRKTMPRHNLIEILYHTDNVHDSNELPTTACLNIHPMVLKHKTKPIINENFKKLQYAMLEEKLKLQKVMEYKQQCLNNTLKNNI